ncbi:primosomal protein DnaT [Atlantibacter subterraneus]|uniref:primosomal protein DnaT n=1 Tax=Atlantibacter subterraneus TaxID=255519 RepID=UPI0029651BED|nr:primosomal protein DnaT [Atlantibacter subterranea]MDW2742670.1 primosomal protein DnaT [Atlantibacter subterranea]
MSSRILTPDVIGIDAFNNDPQGALSRADNGALAVFKDNVPAFYAVSPARMAELMALEARLNAPQSDVALEDQLFDELTAQSHPVPVPLGKFAMYPAWKPDADFQRMAALWGVNLIQPVTDEELATFISYWQAEGKVFHHVQWQQKLARSVQISRASNGGAARRDVNSVPQPDNSIPVGFRG